VGTALYTCPLCEAMCGLELSVDGDDVTHVRGDAHDPFSRGFICPKGVHVASIRADPDRLRTPLVRDAGGDLRPASWEEAYARVAERLGPILQRGGRDAAAVYLGNPSAHNLSGHLYGRVLIKALGTRNVFTASTVDQIPKQLASAHMFGSGFAVPVPDVDRTDLLLILGANPAVSNGSLMTAPDMRGRMRAIQDRGGRVLVVDPRRTRTAVLADEHLPIRPGTDALLLMALVHVLLAEGLADLGAAAGHCAGLDALPALAEGFEPEAVAPACGIAAERIRALAAELAAAPTAAVYGRIGTTTQTFGAAASWLVDVVNALTGNLDRPGGAMFTRPAVALVRGAAGSGPGARFGRWASRVRGLGEVFGELPVAAMAEEMLEPGDGQVRALVTIAGNPAVSTPDSARLERALEGLELMVCVDLYVNETTRHADVILPAPPPLERPHYELLLANFAVRNVAHYSAPVFASGLPDEWDTILRLAAIAGGAGPDADVEALDEQVALTVAGQLARDAGSRAHGREPAELVAETTPRTGPERLLDLQLRAGPYGLTLADLEAAPHGLDLGALEPRLPGVLRTASGRVELAPEALAAEVPRMRAALAGADGGVVLIGRRDLRSNNSWMHNLPGLVSGPERCTLHVHPDDAAPLGLGDGDLARVRSRTGVLEVPVHLTADIMPGVVSLPHGWGHGADGVRLGVARAHAGVNSNVLADGELLEPLSGTAVLNGIPVQLAAV
jgi:anaerobic selenocysteine-containing dehydrogenase